MWQFPTKNEQNNSWTYSEKLLCPERQKCIGDDCVNWSTAYSVTLNIASGPQRAMTWQGSVPIYEVTSQE